MRCYGLLVFFSCLLIPSFAQPDSDGPTDEKAQKTYKHAVDDLQHHRILAALDNFKKADKQDGGHCLDCQRQMIKYGIELQDWKTAETAAEEMVAEAQSASDQALAHFNLGRVLRDKALAKHKDEFLAQAHEEMAKALTAAPTFSSAMFADGQILARLKRDDAAKTQFEQFVKTASQDEPLRQRALRYISNPELARARMAPAFSITTTDGRQVSLDGLKGKVVLIDFWATWCAPCRAALPHMREIAKKFKDQPLVVLSISLDDNEQKWKDYITKYEMTWPQYRDGGLTGPIATLFSVKAIPQTFTIDADGVLQDQHIGDASIEGKLKKLMARARELQVAETPKQ